MKHLKYFAAFITLLLFFGSCNQNRIYREYIKDFPAYHWSSKNVCEFSPKIEDTSVKYNIYFLLRHVYGFQNKNIKINVEIISPTGKTFSKDYVVQVFKNKKEYISDCGGDLCDLTTLIEKQFTFLEKGVYTVKIKNVSVLDPLLNVMEVGLAVEISE